jgi:hypothetical protein
VKLPRGAFDIWHDRAVFHFLPTAEQRDAYIRAQPVSRQARRTPGNGARKTRDGTEWAKAVGSLTCEL